MRITVGCVVWTMMAGLSFAQESEGEKAAKQFLEGQKKTLEVLKEIKDKESAAKAKPTLEKLGKEAESALRVLIGLKPEEGEALKNKYRGQIDPIAKQIEAEVVRIEKDAALRDALKDVWPLKNRLDSKTAVARVQLNLLSRALDTYKVLSGDYPETLEALTVGKDGGRPILEKTALIDPWGKPYKYDPAGPMNKKARPDVWSDGPPGGQMIGNWMK